MAGVAKSPTYDLKSFENACIFYTNRRPFIIRDLDICRRWSPWGGLAIQPPWMPSAQLLFWKEILNPLSQIHEITRWVCTTFSLPYRWLPPPHLCGLSGYLWPLALVSENDVSRTPGEVGWSNWLTMAELTFWRNLAQEQGLQVALLCYGRVNEHEERQLTTRLERSVVWWIKK